MRSWGIGFGEWNSAFLCGTDLLILAVLGFWFIKLILKKSRFAFSNYDWFLIGFIIISVISIKNALNQTLGFYQLLKLTEFSLLYFYIKSNLGQVFDLLTASFVFLASGIFQAILSIFQYVRQSDLGLRLLGETVLNPDLSNVAIFLANGEKILRSYGTTPHPNVLAFFLFVAIFIYYFLYIEHLKFTRSKIGLALYAVLLFGFFFTFSRTIIFGWLVVFVLLPALLNVENRRKLKRIILTTLLVTAAFSVFWWPQVLARLQVSPQEEAVSLRGFYNKVSLFEKPFWGVGIGNFVNWFKEINPGLTQHLYQPVHNIYLLIFSETGILGLAMFILFLFFLAKNYLSVSFSRSFHFGRNYESSQRASIPYGAHHSLLIIFLSILFFGLFDHFLWTLQQGGIILWLILGLIASVFESPYSSTG